MATNQGNICQIQYAITPNTALCPSCSETIRTRCRFIVHAIASPRAGECIVPCGYGVVFIAGVGFMPNRSEAIADEARLLYVAMTRATEYL